MPVGSDLKPMRFATDAFPERERLSRWREEFGRTLVGVDIVPSATDVPFWAEAILQKLPGVNIATCSGSRAFMDRTSALIAAESDPSLTVGLIINTASAPLPVRQHNCELILEQGDAVLVRHEEACAISASGHVGLVLPRAALAARCRDLDGAVMKQISRDNPALRLLLGYISMIQSDLDLGEPAINGAIADHIHDLAALALASATQTHASLLMTRRRRKKNAAGHGVAAIANLYTLTATEARVLDALLRVNGVKAMAETLGLSPATVKTHLHNLFRKTGTMRQSDLVKLVLGI